MKEQFLHYVWQYHRFNHQHLQTTQGESIQILDYGWLNPNDGPDFLNAKVLIDNVLWVGHVEIHLQTSDWLKHHHDKNAHYNNVILHVVYRHDQEILHLPIPTLELNGLIPKSIYDKYLSLVESPSLLPCQHLIHDIEPHLIEMFLQRLSVERLEGKVAKIDALLQNHQYDFEQVAFIWLSRYFGIGSNADAFQELSTQIPIQWCYKIRHQPNSITALLMGKAGFLQQLQTDEEYLKDLKSTYEYLRHKWQIKTLEPQWWKWKMGRPASFPTLKLAQLSQLIQMNSSLFELILQPEELANAILGIQLDSFWDDHYLLNKTSVHREKSISTHFSQRIVINVCIPMMIAYGRHIDDVNWVQKGLDILESLPAEHNNITQMMQKSGLKNEHAMDSQALLHLKNEYCDLKNCLKCQIGHRIIQSPSYVIQEPSFDTVGISFYI